MLGKLLKYDFKALARVMLPLQGGVLLAGILGCFLVNFTYRSISNNLMYSYSSYRGPAAPIEEVSGAVMGMLAVLFFSLVFASFFVTLFLVARHFYKNFLRDEGYLTFTLPVTTTQNLLSKTIAGFVWLIINATILVIVAVLLSLVGFADYGLVNAGVVEVYGEMFSELSNGPGLVLLIELIVIALVGTTYSILQVYVSLIIGASIAKSYKLLAGIGIYVAISTVMQGFVSFIVFFFAATFASGSSSFYSMSEFSWFYEMQPFLLPSLIVSCVCSVVFFLVGKHLLNTKLNLE